MLRVAVDRGLRLADKRSLPLKQRDKVRAGLGRLTPAKSAAVSMPLLPIARYRLASRKGTVLRVHPRREVQLDPRLALRARVGGTRSEVTRLRFGTASVACDHRPACRPRPPWTLLSLLETKSLFSERAPCRPRRRRTSTRRRRPSSASRPPTTMSLAPSRTTRARRSTSHRRLLAARLPEDNSSSSSNSDRTYLSLASVCLPVRPPSRACFRAGRSRPGPPVLGASGLSQLQGLAVLHPHDEVLIEHRQYLEDKRLLVFWQAGGVESEGGGDKAAGARRSRRRPRAVTRPARASGPGAAL